MSEKMGGYARNAWVPLTGISTQDGNIEISGPEDIQSSIYTSE